MAQVHDLRGDGPFRRQGHGCNPPDDQGDGNEKRLAVLFWKYVQMMRSRVFLITPGPSITGRPGEERREGAFSPVQLARPHVVQQVQGPWPAPRMPRPIMPYPIMLLPILELAGLQ